MIYDIKYTQTRDVDECSLEEQLTIFCKNSPEWDFSIILKGI